MVKRENKIITLEENGRGGRGGENIGKRERKEKEGRCCHTGGTEKEEEGMQKGEDERKRKMKGRGR